MQSLGNKSVVPVAINTIGATPVIDGRSASGAVPFRRNVDRGWEKLGGYEADEDEGGWVHNGFDVAMIAVWVSMFCSRSYVRVCACNSSMGVDFPDDI
jgi:hypothetical protein